MASAGDEDLVASKTDGFKVGEKKTVEEYAKLGEPFPDCTSSVVRLLQKNGRCSVLLRWLLDGHDSCYYTFQMLSSPAVGMLHQSSIV